MEPSQAQTADNPDAVPSTHSTPTEAPNANGKRIMLASKTAEPTPPKSDERADVLPVPKRQGAATHQGNRLQCAREALIQWRIKTRCTLYSPSPFTATGILPDSILKTLASNAWIHSLADMAHALQTPWVFMDKHGEEVIHILKETDRSFQQAADVARRQEKEARKAAKDMRRKDAQIRETTAQTALLHGTPLVGSMFYNVTILLCTCTY